MDSTPPPAEIGLIKQIFHSSSKNRCDMAFRLVPYITSYSSRCRGISVKYMCKYNIHLTKIGTFYIVALLNDTD